MKSIDDAPKPKRGERAAKIRRLAALYPEMGSTGIARRVGCSVTNVNNVVSRMLAGESEDTLREFQSSKADAWDSISMRALGSITTKKLEKSSAAALTMVAGTAEDKSRLIRGMPTGLDVHVLLDIAAMVRGDKG